MTVSVLVPFRSDGGQRDEVWAFLREKWQAEHPDWEIIEGVCPEEQWVKGLAVSDAMRRASGDILVIADADVWCDGVAEAVRHVRDFRFKWAIPQWMLYRLSKIATDRVMEGKPIDITDVVEKPYICVQGGGMVVIRRDLYRRAPIDPRFVGWGGEDMAAAVAWRTLGSTPWRGDAPLYHLWHKSVRTTTGSVANKNLYRRYAQLQNRPEKMKKLIAEFT